MFECGGAAYRSDNYFEAGLVSEIGSSDMQRSDLFDCSANNKHGSLVSCCQKFRERAYLRILKRRTSTAFDEQLKIYLLQCIQLTI